MSFFSKGDKVTVRRDLIIDKEYFMEDGFTADTFVGGMGRFLGREVTIKSANRGGKYTIEEYGCNWTDEMFEEYFYRNHGILEVDAATEEEMISFLGYAGLL